MSVNITQQGIVNASAFSETFVNPLDTEFYVEPDNSVWIRIIHHNNPASARFSSTDTFSSSVYYDTDRWFYASLVNKITNGTYEFMVKQKTTSSATEQKFRWIQTKNPFEATYNDVKAANITKITTGYDTNDFHGGVYKTNNSTFFVIANATNGNWYGALGSWTAYNGGIPGFPNTTVTTGYMDLYLRIDNQVNNIASIFDNSVIASEFIEW